MSVFIRNKGGIPQTGFPIKEFLRHSKNPTGQVGLEIEVEGNKFAKYGPHEDNVDPDYIPKMWGYHHDGSLRGQDNAEYVLKQPLPFSEIPDAIGRLWDMFDDYGTVLSESNRTSVHVHLNVQDWHLNRLAAFVGMYFALEDVLTHWCGDHRVGNLFCLRAKDARAIVSAFKEFVRTEGNCEVPGGLHYSGLNLGAITKFGSLEIRALSGATDPSVILDWVRILERLYNLSAEFTDPRSVISGFSGAGPMAWLENILGPEYDTVVRRVPMEIDDIRASLYEGIRLAQDVCYCRDWSKYVPTFPAKDPFGRVERKKTAFSAMYSNASALVTPSPIASMHTFELDSPLPQSYQEFMNNTATAFGGAIPSPDPEIEEEDDGDWDDDDWGDDDDDE